MFTISMSLQYLQRVAADKLVHANIAILRLDFLMYFWYFLHAFINIWWMRSIYSYQWLMASSLERTYKQTLVRHWRIAIHMPVTLLFFTNHSCLHTRRLLEYYTRYSYIDLSRVCIINLVNTNKNGWTEIFFRPGLDTDCSS